MKFRNKATKEIRKAEMRDDGIYLYSETAEEWRKCDWEVLAKYWEEYREEPKVGYIIDPMEEDCISADYSGYEEPDIERAKELGIWFETEEEAELAVCKLKARKRLKDARFAFGLPEYTLNEDSSIIGATGSVGFSCLCYEDFDKDLSLLFRR